MSQDVVSRWKARGERLCRALRARRPGYRRTWIDVGAHRGETTIGAAAAHPKALLVYAFEANPAVAVELVGRLANYVVLPFAVCENDGFATFHVHSLAASSSLLELNADGVARWIGGELLQEDHTAVVPTVRLDTFMNAAAIDHVERLKVDAQGADLQVLRSAGDRLSDIGQVIVEAPTVDFELYKGGARGDDIVSFLTARGFCLVSAEAQSHGQEENLLFERRS
jgi:FkbM family methyltransferase